MMPITIHIYLDVELTIGCGENTKDTQQAEVTEGRYK